MASIISELKAIQRVLSVTVRAGEKCFPQSNISSVNSEFNYDEFILSISLDIFDNDATINASGDGSTGKKCIAAFITDLKKETKSLLKDFEKDEKERQSDIQKYGEACSDSMAVPISACKMFLTVVDSIQY
ncbi:hypothetical protein BIZ37_27930 [Photobacterium sp. BZF1]|uniref:hypothetical protein n=1 Tax=Photobacterium sp. BZF1 TaxID=1904457 RepID=UPI001653843B|nr:hypothetical protein [Photobacterium sp. BZF1]MBC7006391.1 hypothetical protein [Photobacterium sp. BZF1]